VHTTLALKYLREVPSVIRSDPTLAVARTCPGMEVPDRAPTLAAGEVRTWQPQSWHIDSRRTRASPTSEHLMAPCELLLWRIFGPLLDPAKLLTLKSWLSLRLELELGVSAAEAEVWDGFLSSSGKPEFSRRPSCIQLLASRSYGKQCWMSVVAFVNSTLGAASPWPAKPG
jgi:hypothetical protein